MPPLHRLPRGSRTGFFYLEGPRPAWVVTLERPNGPTRTWLRRSQQGAALCQTEIERGETPPGEVFGLVYAVEAQA